MTVEDKIIFAEYFLAKIKYAKNREDFLPNLSAFLSEACSIPNYLLEDANVKFGLGIPLEERLYENWFIETAKKQKNAKALEFISSYKSEFAKIRQDSVGELLIGKRNISVHRKAEQVKGKFARGLTETLDIHDSVTVEVRDKYGNLKMRSDSRDMNGILESKEQPETKEKESTIKSTDSVEWFFEDYTDKDVVGVCDDFLKLVKTFVNNLKTQLP